MVLLKDSLNDIVSIFPDLSEVCFLLQGCVTFFCLFFKVVSIGDGTFVCAEENFRLASLLAKRILSRDGGREKWPFEEGYGWNKGNAREAK